MVCVFCEDKNVKARKIAENDLAWAFVGNIPIVPGHTIIVPTRHAVDVRDLTPKENEAIFDLVKKIQKAMIKIFGAHGFNHAFNQGAKAGQDVLHFHLHVIPRTPGDTGIVKYEPREFLYRPGSRATSQQKELLEVAAILRRELK